ncbi:hypothetical protein F4782DRAFT_398178 [Xylaria castorea]|nr:hypothetical protein F4782DRAFT_398178 [Xylaria castorea]
MLTSKALALALSIAIVAATPLSISLASRVVRREPPAPVAFPLGDACGNEWQYLNFDPENDTDKGHLQTLHDIICSGEMRALSSWGAGAATAGNLVYKRYFPLSDDEDDFQGHVNSVLMIISGQSSTEGSIGTVVGSFVVDNLDFAGTCSAEEGTLAYTNTDDLDNREKIKFCDIAWERPNLEARSMQCGDFDAFPSTKMDTFSRVALHEMTHYSSVGPPSTLGQQIQDVTNEDGVKAYEPPRVHGLVDPQQDDNPAVTEINADSYAWMALDAWLSMSCSDDKDTYDQFFTENPPAYEHEDDGEDN